MQCPYCEGRLRKFGTYGPKKIQRYRCMSCDRTSTGDKKADGMRIPEETFIRIIQLLTEGVGINATARITDTNKETVLRSLVLAGERCEKLMDSRMRDLRVTDIQCDEIWGFVGKKQRHVKFTDNQDLVGDQYTFVALDRNSKLVVSYLVGKRTAPTAQHFIADLSERLSWRP